MNLQIKNPSAEYLLKIQQAKIKSDGLRKQAKQYRKQTRPQKDSNITCPQKDSRKHSKTYKQYKVEKFLPGRYHKCSDENVDCNMPIPGTDVYFGNYIEDPAVSKKKGPQYGFFVRKRVGYDVNKTGCRHSDFGNVMKNTLVGKPKHCFALKLPKEHRITHVATGKPWEKSSSVPAAVTVRK